MLSVGTIIGLILAYKYFIILPFALIWQPLIGMLAGFLARLGYLDVYVVYGALVVTAVVGDIMWYWIGYRWGEPFMRRFGWFFGVTPKHIAGVQKMFDRYHTPILFFSKLTNGMGLALVTLFTAGFMRVPFWGFVGINVLGEAVWSGMIVSVGYFLGNAYITVNDVMGKVFITAIVVAVFVLAFSVTNRIRRRILSEL